MPRLPSAARRLPAAAAALLACLSLAGLAGCESLAGAGGDDPTQRGLVKKGDGRGVSDPYIVRDSGGKGAGQPSTPANR